MIETHEPADLAKKRTGAPASTFLLLRILLLVAACGLQWAAIPAQTAGPFPARADAGLAPREQSAQPGLRLRDAGGLAAAEWRRASADRRGQATPDDGSDPAALLSAGILLFPAGGQAAAAPTEQAIEPSAPRRGFDARAPPAVAA